MDAAVTRLASTSGRLKRVVGSRLPGDRYSDLLFEFTDGLLKLGCDPDTDEIVVSIVKVGETLPNPTGTILEDLSGLSIECAWELRNHRGYVDGFQLRLREHGGREEVLQFEVSASAIEIRRLVD